MAIVARQDAYTVPAVQGFALVKYPIVYRPTIAVDGILVDDADILDYNSNAFGQSGKWYWYGPPLGVDPSDLSWAKKEVTKGTGTLSIGQVVTVVYFGDGNSATTVGNPLQPIPPTGSVPLPGESFGICGSGIFEAVEEVNDVTTLAELQQISDGLLARSGVVPKLIDFETDQPGLKPRMLIPINIPAFDLAGDFLITAVSARANDAPRKYGSIFTYTIKCTSTKDLGDWVKWFERLISRTKKPKPVEQYEIATFVLAPGASLAAGLAVTNAYPVKQDGQLVDFSLQAEVPPTAEILKVDLIYYPADESPEVSIFPGAKPSISPGDRSLNFFTEFSKNPFFVQAGSLIRCNVSYQIVGFDFAPAESATGVLRILV